MEVILGKLLATLLIPPGLMFSMMLAGAILRLRFYRTGQIFIYSGIFLLVTLSLPVITDNVARYYEDMPAFDETSIRTNRPAAIVILAGGRNTNAPEYRNDTISRHSLERVRYGAYLHHKIRLPILVTGGRVYGDESISEAELLQQALQNEFNVTTKWVEDKSRTTYENAVFTQTILAGENISHILLVTHAIHMPRSKEAFEQAGFTVTPAPTSFHTKSSGTLIGGLLPAAHALDLASQLFHEWIGRLWYRIRYY